MQDVLKQEIATENLELGMQELEAMEAPGFWSGFKQGVVISGIAVASATLAT
ncbi:daptide-type RiPP [Streptomyces sp. NPDC012794]|uniref:daptide-type RiPP n=1 Tax=Streptomyces sp. NPDC012794 TaxID=3364850 RepID=UPI00369B7E34